MTATRIRILENQQTGVAKKVYGAVPINEAWPSKQIVMELSRQGQVRDFSIIEGCLNTLKEVGLIKETAPGHFQRVKPKPTAEKEAEPMTTKPLTTPPKSEHRVRRHRHRHRHRRGHAGLRGESFRQRRRVGQAAPTQRLAEEFVVSTQEQLQRSLKFWTGKAATLKLTGEHETYKWEYDVCLEKMALFQRLLDKKQEALLRSSSIKASP